MSTGRPEKSSCAIIGAGPAGLFAAERIAVAGHRVTLFDRMPSPARKFLMAGRGGLNLTHSEPLEPFLTRYGTGAKPTTDAIRKFPPSELRAWADALGADTFTGSSGRVFPKAMKASPLLRAWLRRLADLGVDFKLRHTWTGWDAAGALAFRDAANQPISFHSDATLLALGGASWPRLGSDGTWAEILTRAGVPMSPLAPANVGCHIAWSDVFRQRFEGTPLKRIAVNVGGMTGRGEAVITRDGLEGGVIYALTPAIRSELCERGAAVLSIDLRPDLSASDLERRLEAPRSKQSASTFLAKTLSLTTPAIGLLREGFGGALPSEPHALAARVKCVPLPVTSLGGLARAISTAGGVRLDAVDPSFMLKNKPGVFVAGEMLDWEAPTGGYLLQATFATAAVAADGMLARLHRS